jgi:hypothetical protein
VPAVASGPVPIADAAVGHWSGEYDHDRLGQDAQMLDSNGDGHMEFARGRGATSGQPTQYGGAYLWLGPHRAWTPRTWHQATDLRSNRARVLYAVVDPR